MDSEFERFYSSIPVGRQRTLRALASSGSIYGKAAAFVDLFAHASVRRQRIHGTSGADKTAVVGVKDRSAGKVVAFTDRRTLQGFVTGHTANGAEVFTDEAAAYRGPPHHHPRVPPWLHFIAHSARTRGNHERTPTV